MATYTVSATALGGPVTITITSSVSGLTNPTNTLINVAEVTEDIEHDAYVHDVGSCELEIVDDYSTHSNGFWWELLESSAANRLTTVFRITYSDDGTARELFWGRPAVNGITWDERYDSGSGSYIRIARIVLESQTMKLKDISVATAMTNLKGGSYTKYWGNGNYEIAVAAGGDRPFFWKMTDILAAICSSAGFAFNGTINGQDIGYKVDGAYKDIEDLYVYGGYGDTAHSVTEHRGYFDTNALGNQQEYAWELRFQTAWDLLNHILKSLAVVGRWNLQGGGAHVLELYTRRRALATTVTMSGSCISSIAESRDDLLLRNIHIWNTTNPPRLERGADGPTGKTETFYGRNAWILRVDNVRSGAITDAVSGANSNPPEKTTAGNKYTMDLEYGLDFTIDPGSNSALYYKDHSQVVYLDNPAGSPTEYDINYFTHIRNYSYQAEDWSSDLAVAEGITCFAMRNYIADLYRMPRHALTRTYNSCKANDGSINSHLTLQPLKRITVNQGSDTTVVDRTAVTFYAKRVTKNIMNNTATVEWLEE